MKIKISVNDRERELDGPASLTELILQSKDEFSGPFAVAVNGEFVPRHLYQATPLQQGDQIDIVSPVGGG